ncbi:MAG: ABC transporter substrate-binding protein, partial [Patescibacteria group bacterium]
PAGTNETDWYYGMLGQFGLLKGHLAESFELIKPGTIIFHVRQGVHWALNPKSAASQLVNGREFTADDVVFSLTRHALKSPLTTMYQRFTAIGKPPTITKLDKYTVEVKVDPDMLGYGLTMLGNFTLMWPHEVIEKYGDMKDWRNSVGTGPFMVTEYVAGSAMTYVRNPNFFMTDPVGPGKGNQLPYLDGFRTLIIPDPSTSQAAFRTGKIDRMDSLTGEDWEGFMKQRPDLKYKASLSIGSLPAGRLDKPALPFKDIRVRQAMNLAVNKKEILDNYYKGRGALFAVPVPPGPSHAKMFTPLEEQPSQPTIPGSRASVQELFTYNPEKAKLLLKEAGYPNGFKTEFVVSPTGIDLASILKDQLSKVGIELVLK